MLRVCFLIQDFSDGGAQKQCIFLLNALQRQADLDLTLIRFREGLHDPLLDRERLRVFTLDHRSNLDPRIPFEVASILRRTKADIVITWLIAADIHGFFVRGLAGRSVKWLLTERNSRHPDIARFRLRFLLGRYADALVSNSAAGDALWARIGRPLQRATIANIVAPALSAASAEPGNVVAYAGRLEPHKNVLSVASAFAHLAPSRTDLHFEIIGQGSLEPQLRSDIARSGAEPRIRLTGFLADFPGHLSRLRVLVSLSRHEGLPNVLLEAAAANVPIIASSIPEHRALLGDAYPYLIDPDADPMAVAALIERVADNPHARDALAPARARLATMTEAAIAAQYLSLFHQVARKDAPEGACYTAPFTA